MFDPILLIISLLFMGLGMYVSSRLKKKFAQYAHDFLSSGLSGREIANKMLNDNGIYDVKILSVEGELTDHYNPANKTVNLSYDVYHGKNISAAAVAAHECGHAVQHATAYQWLTMRSQLVPVVQISSTILNYLTIGLALVAFSMPALTNGMLLLFIILQSTITLFSLITLPVELDASRRALSWLNQSNLTRGQEHEKAKDALNWAAYTYVVSALAAVATLLYYIWRFTGNNREE
jgi:Zn-dependent membrane protease YugP